MKEKSIHKWLLILTIILIPIIIIVSTMVKNQMDIPRFFTQEYEEAVVRLVLEEDLKPDPVVEDMLIGKQILAVEVLTGPYKGEVQEVIIP